MLKRNNHWGWLIVAALSTAGPLADCSAGDSDPSESPNGGQGGGDDDHSFTSSSSASGGKMDDDICEAVSEEATNQIRPVDIIWAIDTSPSMTAEKQAVRNNINLFAQQIADAEIDVHVVMIATPLSDGGICVDAPLGNGSCPNDHNPPGYHHNTNWVGSHNALGRFIGEYTEYKSALREDSLKYFVVVTDDSANISAASFSNQINQLDPGWFDEWKVFGLFCGYSDSGGTYQTLVTQTGGLAVELCQSKPNWQSVFDGFVTDVVNNKALACAWEIPTPPDGKQLDPNKVNVSYTAGGQATPQSIYFAGKESDCGVDGGWFYDDPSNPTTIELCPLSCSAIQSDVDGKIDILFGCLTESTPK